MGTVHTLHTWLFFILQRNTNVKHFQKSRLSKTQKEQTHSSSAAWGWWRGVCSFCIRDPGKWLRSLYYLHYRRQHRWICEMEGCEHNAQKCDGSAQGQAITQGRPAACQDQNGHMKTDLSGWQFHIHLALLSENYSPTLERVDGRWKEGNSISVACWGNLAGKTWPQDLRADNIICQNYLQSCLSATQMTQMHHQ